MGPRGTIIAALVVVELAIAGTAINAVRGNQPTAYTQFSTLGPAPGAAVAEGGPHKVFSAGPHPALAVDIGYADLTIVARNAARMDVAVAKDPDMGPFRATGPILAREDGTTLRVTASQRSGFSAGDNRMVTLEVPPQTEVTVARAGDVTLRGLRAQARIHSVGSGWITVEDYDGPTLDVSAKGTITLRDVAAQRLDATSSNSRIEGSALRVRDGSIDADERISLGLAPGSNTLVTAAADDGEITASGFPAGAAVPVVRSGRKADASSQTVRVGSGGGHLDVHSGSGDITLASES